jgi:CRISPR-associated protein Cas1
LLARAISGKALLRAWEEVRHNAYADGDPGAAVLAFENHALTSLTELAKNLAESTYQPRPLTGVTIPKPAGGSRKLAVGADSIPRWAVLERLAELVPDTELVGLVQRLIGRPVLGQPQSNGFGLHQGSGLSPVLSNLYLDVFDRRMMSLGHQVIRYGDDVAIPVSDRPAGDRVLELASVEAATLKLRLESTKSRVVSYDEGVPFCGQIVTATTSPGNHDQSRPLQGTVFVTTEGALLCAKGERVRVEKADELLANVNFNRVRQIVCVGRVGVTSTLLRHVAERGIDLAWLYEDGRYAARLTTLSGGGDPELRLAQYQAALDERRGLRIARQFVAGKITNMRVGLLRAARSQEQPGLADRQPRLAAARTTALAAANITALMGCEGAATRDYFDGLSRILGSEWGFTTRQRRPPPDPVNAMLSFGYTLLLNEAVTACVLASLDPYLGMLHSPHRNRPRDRQSRLRSASHSGR